MNKNLSITSDRVTVTVLSDVPSSQDIAFKVIIVGDSGVGKSCLTMKAIKNTFTEGHNATVGFDFFTFCTLISCYNLQKNNYHYNTLYHVRSLLFLFYYTTEDVCC